MEISDEILVERILSGESTLFAQLVDRYKTIIFNVMLRYSGCRDDADELTQDVFCKLFRMLSRYKGEKLFFSWMYTVSLNHVKDWSRNRALDRKKTVQLALSGAGDFIPKRPDLHLEQREAVEGLYAALARISEDRQELLLLRYRHERSIKELAEIFELSESAVKMRINRSIAMLRELLDEEGTL